MAHAWGSSANWITRTPDTRCGRESIVLPDGTVASGRRVLHVRRNADGSEDIIEVEA
jgi:hypothetical protein